MDTLGLRARLLDPGLSAMADARTLSPGKRSLIQERTFIIFALKHQQLPTKSRARKKGSEKCIIVSSPRWVVHLKVDRVGEVFLYLVPLFP